MENSKSTFVFQIVKARANNTVFIVGRSNAIAASIHGNLEVIKRLLTRRYFRRNGVRLIRCNSNGIQFSLPLNTIC